MKRALLAVAVGRGAIAAVQAQQAAKVDPRSRRTRR